MHTFGQTIKEFHNTFAGIRLSELVPDKTRQCYVKMFGHLREVCATYELTLTLTIYICISKLQLIKKLVSSGQRLLSKLACSTWHKHGDERYNELAW